MKKLTSVKLNFSLKNWELLPTRIKTENEKEKYISNRFLFLEILLTYYLNK